MVVAFFNHKHGSCQRDSYDVLTLDEVVDRLSAPGGPLAAAADANGSSGGGGGGGGGDGVGEPDPNAGAEQQVAVAAKRVEAVEADLQAAEKNMKMAAGQVRELREQLEALAHPTISEEECNRVLGIDDGDASGSGDDDDVESKVDAAADAAPAGQVERFIPQGLTPSLLPGDAVVRAVFKELTYKRQPYVELNLSDQDFYLLSSPQGSMQLEIMQTLKDQKFVYVSSSGVGVCGGTCVVGLLPRPRRRPPPPPPPCRRPSWCRYEWAVDKPVCTQLNAAVCLFAWKLICRPMCVGVAGTTNSLSKPGRQTTIGNFAWSSGTKIRKRRPRRC